LAKAVAVNGVIFDIKKFAVHDGPGIRTTVFFKGCPLICGWCHNPESRHPEPERLGDSPGETVGYRTGVDELLEEIKKDKVFYDQSGGGVTFSGGEPMEQIDFLVAIAAACRDEGISTALDTCGYATYDKFETIVSLMDYILYDIKLIDEALHIEYTGVSNKIILENLKALADSGRTIIPRVPLIPGVTDTDNNLNDIAEFLLTLKNIKLVGLLPYNIFGRGKNRKFNFPDKFKNVVSQTEEQLRNMRNIFEVHGFSVRIGG
jgi:pyruvate formate lyase activating enzyme